MKLLAVVLVLAALIALGCGYSGYLANMLPTAAADLNEISLPPGFHITVYAADVPNARQMAVGPPGVIFVGSRESPAQILPRSPGQPPHLCQPLSAHLRKNDLYE